MLEGLNLRLLKYKGWFDNPHSSHPHPTSALGIRMVPGKWLPEGSVHWAAYMARVALDAELAIGPLSQDRIDDSFLYVTFYPTL